MGNSVCIADGGCPHRADIFINNNTEIPLHLNKTVTCEKDCDHKGFKIPEGKIIEGCEPPETIDAFGNGTFSVSGRESSPICPQGRIFYHNEECNLEVTITWDYAGWHERGEEHALNAVASGSTQEGRIFKKTVAWDELLTLTVDVETWTVEIKPKETLDDVKEITDSIADAIKNFSIL